MIARNETDPHENEYLAAVSGLHEQTPSPRTFAIGQTISGVTKGLRWTGVLLAQFQDWLRVDVGDAWVIVHCNDVGN